MKLDIDLSPRDRFLDKTSVNRINYTKMAPTPVKHLDFAVECIPSEEPLTVARSPAPFAVECPEIFAIS